MIEIDSKGNIYIVESSYINILDSEGKFLKKLSYKDLPGYTFSFRINKDDTFTIKNPGLDGGYGLKKGNVPLFMFLNSDLSEIKRFGQGVFFSSGRYNGGNRLRFAVDEKKNVYTTFLFQNKIQKYSSEGKLIYSADRPVNKNKLFDKKLKLYTTINTGIDVDNKGRVWIAKATRKEKKEERVHVSMYTSRSGAVTEKIVGNVENTETDIYELELFSKNGELLAKYPLTHFCDGLKIINNCIYLCDERREMLFHIYEIIE